MTGVSAIGNKWLADIEVVGVLKLETFFESHIKSDTTAPSATLEANIMGMVNHIGK